MFAQAPPKHTHTHDPLQRRFYLEEMRRLQLQLQIHFCYCCSAMLPVVVFSKHYGVHGTGGRVFGDAPRLSKAPRWHPDAVRREGMQVLSRGFSSGTQSSRSNWPRVDSVRQPGLAFTESDRGSH